MTGTVGAALLCAGSVLTGWCACGHLNGRVKELQSLIRGFEMILREMGYRLAPLPELFEQAAAQSGGHTALFFRLCAQGAEHLNGRTFQVVWQQAVEAGELRLERGDLDILEQLGSVLGRYDGDSQLCALKKAVERLELQREEAEEQSRRLGRVYRVLSVAAGALILILTM